MLLRSWDDKSHTISCNALKTVLTTGPLGILWVAGRVTAPPWFCSFLAKAQATALLLSFSALSVSQRVSIFCLVNKTVGWKLKVRGKAKNDVYVSSVFQFHHLYSIHLQNKVAFLFTWLLFLQIQKYAKNSWKFKLKLYVYAKKNTLKRFMENASWKNHCF